MPKSRVRKKPVYPPPPAKTSARRKVSPPWLAPTMIACFLVGLAWIALYYVTGGGGMPGLRVGWILAPEDLISELWRRHDYMTIMVGTVSAELATVALEPGRRDKLLSRTRQILRSNLSVLEEWIRGHGDLFDYVPPLAGGGASRYWCVRSKEVVPTG